MGSVQAQAVTWKAQQEEFEMLQGNIAVLKFVFLFVNSSSVLGGEGPGGVGPEVRCGEEF